MPPKDPLDGKKWQLIQYFRLNVIKKFDVNSKKKCSRVLGFTPGVNESNF